MNVHTKTSETHARSTEWATAAMLVLLSACGGRTDGAFGDGMGESSGTGGSAPDDSPTSTGGRGDGGSSAGGSPGVGAYPGAGGYVGGYPGAGGYVGGYPGAGGYVGGYPGAGGYVGGYPGTGGYAGGSPGYDPTLYTCLTRPLPPPAPFPEPGPLCGAYDGEPEMGVCMWEGSTLPPSYMRWPVDTCGEYGPSYSCVPVTHAFGASCFSPCSSSFGPGACVPSYVVEASEPGVVPVLEQASCGYSERCVPCIHPLEQTRTGACDN